MKKKYLFEFSEVVDIVGELNWRKKLVYSWETACFARLIWCKVLTIQKQPYKIMRLLNWLNEMMSALRNIMTHLSVSRQIPLWKEIIYYICNEQCFKKLSNTPKSHRCIQTEFDRWSEVSSNRNKLQPIDLGLDGFSHKGMHTHTHTHLAKIDCEKKKKSYLYWHMCVCMCICIGMRWDSKMVYLFLWLLNATSSFWWHLCKNPN